MKTIFYISLLLISFFFCSISSAGIGKDKRLIEELIQIDKESIKSFEKFFSNGEQKPHRYNLGFGWEVVSPMKIGHHLRVATEFYYFDDSLVACRVFPILPDDKRLRKKLIGYLNGYFEVSEDDRLRAHQINFSVLYEPLEEYSENADIKNITKELRELFKPSYFRGRINYFWSGGYEGGMMASRVIFKEEHEKLTEEELILLMYSINPVLRFLAVEEVIRNDLLKEENKKYEDWIQKCFEEVPYMYTLNGCIGSKAISKELVLKFAQLEYR